MKKFGGTEIFIVIIMVIMVLAIVQARKFPFLAAVYPVFVCIVVILCCILALAKHFMGSAATGGVIDIGSDSTLPASERRKKALRAFGWVILLYLLSALLGFKLGAMLFMAGYVSIEARARWYLTTALTALTLLILVIFHRALHVWWAEGLLGTYLVEPFPWLF
jgi:hypothetical protein